VLKHHIEHSVASGAEISVFFHLRVQSDKGHQEREKQWIILLLAKEIKITFQRNYSYQEKGQHA
jgi:hypothetical protein